MAQGKDFLAGLATAGPTFQGLITNLQNLVIAINALNSALTTTLANIPNANG